MDTIEKPEGFSVVGKRVPRVDAAERVTGRAIYPADFSLPGMAFGRIKRSPHAHARILRIDVSKALALKGVLAAVTAEDFADIPQGALVPQGETGIDAWVLTRLNMARGKVFWIGQPVAAIAAVDPHVAEAALDLIEVAYEVLPPVMDIEAATRPGAPVLHDHLYTKGVEPKPKAPSNVGARTLVARGDVAKGFAEADAIAEIEVAVDSAHQGYIEPQAVVAQVEPGGMTTVWVTNQGVFTLEMQIAMLLGIPQSKLKVVPLEIGGGFGGKIWAHVEPTAVLLARKARRPVKIVLSRAEVMTGTGPAPGARIAVKVGARRDGTLTAAQGRFTIDAGGFPGIGTTLLMQASMAGYQCPNLHLEGFDVVTTKPRAEAYRGPGGPQAAYAMEQAMDLLAQQLAMDPLAFRRKNA
ncbi:MAG: xanthine dehydrogenase family protein molybdopterin-binding subunit, partial [Alphaproteobacteria bacterium]|nr:xanthine dehydrogenase family protein molybdopterin-binding subunit [Alphaproteobacteria bacterium]